MKIELNEVEVDLLKNLIECAVDECRYYENEIEILEGIVDKIESEERNEPAHK